MIDDATATDLAARIAEAERSRTPTKQISQLHPGFTIDDAYAVQLAGVRIAEEAGRVVRARKIGLTSLAVQRQLGVDQPDYGMLFADMEVMDGEEIAPGRVMQPKVEAEIAYVIAAPLTGV